MGVVRKVRDRFDLLRTAWLLLLALALVAWPGQHAQASWLRSEPRPAVQAPLVTVRFSPATASVLLGAEFSVDVVIVAGANQVNAADVHLRFDPAHLTVTQDPKAGLFLTTIAKYVYDNTAGTLSFGAYKPNGSTSGTFTLCTIYFRATAPTPSTLITHAQEALVVSPASVVYAIDARDGTVVIAAPTPTPTTTWTPSPTATATHTPILTSTESATITPTPTATVISPDVTASIRPDVGGNLVSRDLRVALQVPPAAVTQNITLTLSYVSYDSSMGETWDRCLLPAGPALRFRAATAGGANVPTWAQPATLTVCFGPGGSVGDLALYYWDEGLGRWTKESTTWEPTGYCVQTQTTHLGLFVVARPAGCVRLPIILSSASF